MKLLVLFAALVASTAVASAEPKLDSWQPSRFQLDNKKPEGSGRVILRDHKPPPPRPKKQVLVDGWGEITDATPTRFGTVYVNVGSVAGPLSKLRFNALTGTVKLRRVKVHFGDGTVKLFAITKTLTTRRQPSTVIDLGSAKVIDQIEITTDRRPAGEYDVHGTAINAGANSCC